jgi:hypothetical protein
MKVFPSKRYHAQLGDSGATAWVRLRQVTHVRDTLVSTSTIGKRFIGQVQPGRFKLIRSAIGKGAFCTFTGDFNGISGTIDVQIHKAFRILMTIWLVLMVFVIIVFSLFQHGLSTGLYQLVMLTFTVIGLRFLLERLFRSMATAGLRELSEVLALEHVSEIKETA